MIRNETAVAETRAPWVTEVRMQLGGFERRGAERFPIQAPVRWAAGGGRTRNISTSGMLFETRTLLAPGEPLKLAVVGEPAQAGEKPTYALCDVVVVRVDRAAGSDESYQVAAQIKSMRLH